MGVCPRSSPPGDLRMVLRTSLGIIIVLTLLVITQGSIPKTKTGSVVIGDHLNVGDINIASSGDAGIRAIVKRNADANPKQNEKTEKRRQRINRRKITDKFINKKKKAKLTGKN